MKIRLSLFIALIIVAVSSCKRLDKLISFTLETNDRVVLPFVNDSILYDSIPDNNVISVFSEDFKFSNYDKFETNKSTPQSVEEVEKWNTAETPDGEPIAMTIEIDSGANTFSYMRDLKVFLVSPNGLFQEKELVKEETPDVVSNIILFSNSEVLPDDEFFLQAMQKDGYKFRTEYKLISAQPDTLKLRYKMKFRVKALPDE
jgi:hypothetical protein